MCMQCEVEELKNSMCHVVEILACTLSGPEATNTSAIFSVSICTASRSLRGVNLIQQPSAMPVGANMLYTVSSVILCCQDIWLCHMEVQTSPLDSILPLAPLPPYLSTTSRRKGHNRHGILPTSQRPRIT